MTDPDEPASGLRAQEGGEAAAVGTSRTGSQDPEPTLILEVGTSGPRGRVEARPLGLGERLEEWIWRQPEDRSPGVLVGVLRLLHGTWVGANRHGISLRASALTYVTVLSIVPTLAFAVSLAKGFGSYELLRDEVIQPWIRELFGPETTGTDEASSIQIREAVQQVLLLVEETDFKALGALGLLILLYSVIKLLSSTERSLNVIFSVQRGRRMVRRLTDYVALAMVAPILLLSALGFFALTRVERVLDWAREHLGSSVAEAWVLALPSYGLLFGGLLLLYVGLPNRPVRLGAAALGSAVGALLCLAALSLHTSFQIGVASFNKIYSSFAAIPIFLFAVYTLWFAVLIGAELAATCEGLAKLRRNFENRDSGGLDRGLLALGICARVTEAFLEGSDPPTSESLTSDLPLSPEDAEAMLDQLEDGKILRPFESRSGIQWVPHRDPGGIPIDSILGLVRPSVESTSARWLRGTRGDPSARDSDGHSESSRLRRWTQSLSVWDRRPPTGAPCPSLEAWTRDSI